MRAARRAALRAVLDSNVYVSAFSRPGGVPARIWQQAITRLYSLLVSPAIISEVAKVLRHDFDWDDEPLIAQMKLLAKIAEIIRPSATLDEIKADPDDNRILECAIDGRADLIVSGDQHLLRLKSFRGIGIIGPMDFLRTLGRAE